MGSAFQAGAFQAGAFQLLAVSYPLPLVLSDLVPGNIGLLGDSVIMLRFDEPAGVLARDEAERLNDLGIEAGLSPPDVVDAFCGVGRNFQAPGTALLAKDRVDTSPDTTTMLPRDVSLCALLSLSPSGASGPQTIIARGINDGTISERYAYGFELEEVSTNVIEMRAFWSDASGAIVTATGERFAHAGDGNEIMLTFTRRWEAGNVVVRYYVDSRLIGEHSFASSISGGITGTTTVGGRKSAGTWSRYLSGVIDELQVVGRELSADEIRCTWERLTVHQPAGVEAFKGLAPPGCSWFANPSSDIAKRAKVVGQAIGLFMAHVEEFRATFLPGKCSAWLLPKWEELYAISPMPLDSLDLRRARILARMAADEGYSIPALKSAFSLLFGLDAASVQILEGTNEWLDSFDALTDERWQPGAVGTWSITGGQLKLSIPSGTAINQDPTFGQCFIQTPLDRVDGGQVYFAAQVVDFAGLPSGSFVGMFLHQRTVARNTLWFGMYNDGTSIKLVTSELSGSPFLTTGITTIATIPAGPVWLRINVNSDPNAIGGLSTCPATLSWSTTGPSSGFTDYTTVVYRYYDLAGFAAFNTSTPGVSITAHFDDAHMYVPNGLVPFVWFAYRDPALAGSYDLINANILARKVSPAHMLGGACSSKRLLAGDPVAGLCGSVPMGSQ